MGQRDEVIPREGGRGKRDGQRGGGDRGKQTRHPLRSCLQSSRDRPWLGEPGSRALCTDFGFKIVGILESVLKKGGGRGRAIYKAMGLMSLCV